MMMSTESKMMSLEIKHPSLIFSMSLTTILECCGALDIVNEERYKGTSTLSVKSTPKK
jgi:hypothetical protein